MTGDLKCKHVPYQAPCRGRRCAKCDMAMPLDNPAEVLRNIAQGMADTMGLEVNHDSFDRMVDYLNKPEQPLQPVIVPPNAIKQLEADPRYADAVKRGDIVANKPIPLDGFEPERHVWQTCPVGSCQRHQQCMYLNHLRCPGSG